MLAKMGDERLNKGLYHGNKIEGKMMHKILLMVAMMSLWTSASAAQTTNCTTDNECPGDQICENDLCVDPVQPEHDPSLVPAYVPGCSMDSDCKGDRICENGECVNPVAPAPAPAPVAPVVTATPQPSPPPQAQPAPPGEYNGPFVLDRKGVEIEIRLGATFCVPDAGEECDHFDYGLLDDAFAERKPGPGGGIFIGSRFLPFLAAGIDWGYYFLIVKADSFMEEDIDAKFSRFMNIMLAVRGYLPLEPADIYLKLGAGWLSFKESAYRYEERVSLRQYSLFNFKIGMGATFFLMDGNKRKNVGLGFDFDFMFTNPSRSEECEDKNMCTKDDGTRGLINVFQASVHLTILIPHFK